jgi:putative flippase GtrA
VRGPRSKANGVEGYPATRTSTVRESRAGAVKLARALGTTNQHRASPRLARLAQWLRHHAAAAAGTAADFVVMVAMVEVVGLVPAAATAVGAAGGAVANFLLGRHWAYRRPDGGGLLGQALRYVVVSGVGLGLNAGGVYLLAHRVGLQYVAARVITAVVVANAWSYPMQRFFVFGGGARSRSRSLA